MSEYRERVYRIARRIPAGRVMTYGQIAELLDEQNGQRYTAQTVGWAMHALGDTDCWARVINAKGACSTGKVMLPGNKQQFILESEGIVFDKDGRCELQRYLWIPEEANFMDLSNAIDDQGNGVRVERVRGIVHLEVLDAAGLPTGAATSVDLDAMQESLDG